MKKTKIPTVIAAACAIAITAMDSDADDNSDAKSWREIETGTYSGIEEEQRLVINDPETWKKWWKEHTKNMHDTSQPDGIKPPAVDFEKETVILATAGMHSTGGHHISFSDVSLEKGALTVVLTFKSPGPEDMVTMALTYPFAIIAVPKHEGEVEFVVK